jgi:SSS family solute:Na+ symporter
VLSDSTTYASLLYLGLVTAVGFVVALQSRDRGLFEYFLAGRTTGPMVLGLSVGVTTLGAIGVVLLVNPDIHSQGSALLALAVLLLLLVILAAVVAPKYLVARAMTTPGLIAQRFGRSAGTPVAVAFVLLAAFARLPLVLLGGSWAVSELSGWEPLTTAMLILVLAGLYTTAGGFPSVLVTQAMQGVFAILSVLALLGLSLAGESLVVQPPSVPGAPMTVGSHVVHVLALGVVAVWYCWADQVTLQRVLSARSRDDARRGILVCIAFTAVVALLGLSMIGAGTVPEGETGGQPVVAMVASVLVLSLTFSTAAGMLQSTSAMLTLDIVRPFRRSPNETSLVLAGRLSTTATAVVVLLFLSALGPLRPGDLARFLDAHLAVASPAAAVYVGALFVRRASPQGVIAATLAGGVVGLAYLTLPREWNMPAATFPLLSFAVTMGVLVGVSYASLTPPAGGRSQIEDRADVKEAQAGPVVTR